MTKSSYPEDRVEALLTQIKLPPSYRIFPTQHAKAPLGTAPSDSRFCAATSGFTALYVAPDFATAFIEVVVRDRFRRKNDREIALQEVTLRSSAQISSSPRSKLSILDLRKDGCTRLGAPTDAVNAKNHAAGRALGQDLYTNHTQVDGILFASRLTGEDAYVIFDRATSRLTAGRPEPLALHIELPDVLRHHGISLITRT